ncbi:MAG: hypothetical protein EXX96DRAFT_578669 [Benjaminiella poitrasii]|nr:MAG: hypothetical protein EXX96DRAFT_578669 [Benjaminiella poitrasii]
MLNEQESAWAVYAAAFLFFTSILTYRCRHNILLLPFAVFGMVITIGSICLLASTIHHNDTSVLDATTQSLEEHNDLSSKELLTIGILPITSVLIFSGIVESQYVFIQRMTIAISAQSRELPNKQLFSRHDTLPYTRRPVCRSSWLSLLSLIIYSMLALSVILLLSISAEIPKSGLAICVTLMWATVCCNTILILQYTTQLGRAKVRLIRRNRGDLVFLRLISLLFTFAASGMMALAWIYDSTAASQFNPTAWIVLESVWIYLPLLVILVMCVRTGKHKMQTIGRQYGMDISSHQVYHNEKISKDAEYVVKKISKKEANKLTTPLPNAYIV